MAITRGITWDNGTITDDSSTTITASGTATTVGSLLLAFLSSTSQNVNPTTPSGWTLRTSTTTTEPTWVYEKLNAGSISSLAITLGTTPSASVVHLHVREYKTNLTGFALDQAPAVHTGSATTTVVSNSQTTTGANATDNDICVLYASGSRANITAVTFSSPTNSYALSGTSQGDNDGTTSLRTSVYDKIISSNVTSETGGVTSSANVVYSATLISYSETGGTPVQGIGQVWKGQNVTDSGTTVTASGSATTVGSTLLACVMNKSNHTLGASTPAGWTQRISTGSASIFELVNAGSLTTLSVTITTPSLPVELIVVELLNTGYFDAIAAGASGTSTSPLTAGITTASTNTIMVGFFSVAHASATPNSLSSLTNSFTAVSTQNQQNDGSNSLTQYYGYKVVTTTQSAQTVGCTSNNSDLWEALLVAYASGLIETDDGLIRSRVCMF